MSPELEELPHFKDENSDFSDLRKKAFEAAKELEMPDSLKTPGRTWTRYPEIELRKEKAAPEIDVEGDAEVYTGAEAVEKARGKLFEAVKYTENRLHALHAAHLNSLVYIKARDAEVEIRHTGDQVMSHLVVEAAEEVSVTEYFEGEHEVTTSLGEFYVSENASLTYGSVMAQETPLSYAARKAVVEDYGKMNWLNASFGPELSRQRIETVLKGDDSETEKTGIFYPRGEQHHDLSMHVRHIGERTRCDMKTRGVVDDSSRAIYEGLQKVEERAQDTSSFQRENTLILSDNAEIDAAPKLKIENNDVEASHAASAGRIDPQELYYLNSRGLSRDEARKLVVSGFFEPALEDIELPDMKNRVRKEIEKKLEEKR